MRNSAAQHMSKLAALHTSRRAPHLMRGNVQLHMMRISAPLLMRHHMLSSAPPLINKYALALPSTATTREALAMDGSRSAQVFPRSSVPASLLRNLSRSAHVFQNKIASKYQSRHLFRHQSNPAYLFLSRTVPRYQSRLAGPCRSKTAAVFQ